MSGTPYVGELFITLTGKLYDILIKKFGFNRGCLSKTYTAVGTYFSKSLVSFIEDLIHSSTFVCLYFPGSFGPALILCTFSLFPADKLIQLCLLTVAISLSHVTFTGGFYIAISDFAGPFSGVVFGITNTAAQIPGFLNPTIIALLAPNVRN